MKLNSKGRGTIIPTAMFVAMFVLLMSNVLLARVSLNFDMSLRSVEDTQFRYACYGAVNELLSDLNGGLARDTFTKAHPRQVEQGSRIMESWVEPIENSEDDVFVVARAYRESHGSPAVVRRLVTYHERPESRIYSNATDINKDAADPVFYNDVATSTGASMEWNQLPAPPRVRISSDGTLESQPGKVAGNMPYIVGAPDGSLYGMYAPTLDGWDDTPEFAFFEYVPFPVPMHWGDFALKTIVNGGKHGLTVGDLAPIPQVLVGSLNDMNVSKGAVFLKYTHESGEWTALPAAPEATLVNGEFQVDSGNYHLKGVNGAPAAFDGGMTMPLFRKGQDSIYTYSDKTEQWTVSKPPGKDVLLLAADQHGGTYVQTGSLESVGIPYLARLLLGDMSDIYANTPTSKLSKLEKGSWVTIPDPPAKFYDKNGNLQSRSYPGSRGPTLSAMVGGKGGEFFVVNQPSESGLVDTIYKYSDGAWELMPSPPNKHFDSSGSEIEDDQLAGHVEACLGADGQLIIRVPNADGPDAVFVQDNDDPSGYKMLPAVKGSSGDVQQSLSQMSIGRRRNESGRGSFSVKATYF